MPTYALLTVPSEDVRLGETIDHLADAYCYVEQTAEGGHGDLLHLWVSCRDPSAIPSAFDRDPGVEGALRLRAREGRRLYKVRLERGVHHPRRIVRRHGGIVRESFGDADGWTFDVRFPDHEALARTGTLLDRYDVDATYESVTGGPPSPSAAQRRGLADAEREAVAAAMDLGFYETPPRASLADVAAELGVSHRALSERVRRATQRASSATPDDGTRRPVDPAAR